MRLKTQMPELDGATNWLNGKGIMRNDLIGNKPTLIHFWSISCDLCKKAMPKLNKLRDENRDRLNVIAVHMPRSEKDKELDEISSLATKIGILEPIFVDNENRLSSVFKNRYVPAYYLFDRDGELRYMQDGSGRTQLLQKRVVRMLDRIN
ncbi:TlpA family protein disulfide reductase [Virgibacillus ainsalahensis]